MTKKTKLNWSIIVLFLSIGLFLFWFFGVTIGPSPASNISTTDFMCTEWVGASLSSVNSDEFKILADGSETFLSVISHDDKKFQHYSNECGGSGCAYLGEINQVLFAGKFKDKELGTVGYTAVVVENSEIIFHCTGQSAA